MSGTDLDGVLHLLQMLIRASGLTQGMVEERLGVGRGFLRRLRRGESRLTAERVLQILDVVDMPAVEFVRAAIPFQSPREGLLLEELMRIRPEARPPAPEPLDTSAVEAILDLLRRELPPGMVRPPNEG